MDKNLHAIHWDELNEVVSEVILIDREDTVKWELEKSRPFTAASLADTHNILPAETIVDPSSRNRILARKNEYKSIHSTPVFALFTMPQAMGEQECYDDKVIFKQKCHLSIARDIIYIHPTDSCCRAVQKVDMPCVCRIITPEEEHKINPRYVFYVSQDCNKPVPAGQKCGSWTVPPPPPSPPHHMQQ
ncbi:hypothetical protein EJB05_15009, partial [Eragrostis curvula]